MAEVVHLPCSLLVYFGRLTVDRVLYLARLQTCLLIRRTPPHLPTRMRSPTRERPTGDASLGTTATRLCICHTFQTVASAPPSFLLFLTSSALLLASLVPSYSPVVRPHLPPSLSSSFAAILCRIPLLRLPFVAPRRVAKVLPVHLMEDLRVIAEHLLPPRLLHVVHLHVPATVCISVCRVVNRTL